MSSTLKGCDVVRPRPSAWKTNCPRPGALPQAMRSQPFGLKTGLAVDWLAMLGVHMTTHSRRDFLWHLGGGLGGLALTQLLAEAGEIPGAPKPKAEFNGGLHHVAKVKRVVQLFMNGGVSQMD